MTVLKDFLATNYIYLWKNILVINSYTDIDFPILCTTINGF